MFGVNYLSGVLKNESKSDVQKMNKWTTEEYLYDLSAKIYSAMMAARLLEGDVSLVNPERLAKYAVDFASCLLDELDRR